MDSFLTNLSWVYLRQQIRKSYEFGYEKFFSLILKKIGSCDNAICHKTFGIAILFNYLFVICVIGLCCIFGSTQIQASNNTLLCRRCSLASALSDCNTFEACDITLESCYIDQLITDQLTVVYSAGCRAKDVCLTASGTIGIGRKKDSLVACSRCCNTQNDCNSKLCGIKDDTMNISQCYHCDHRSSSQAEVTNPADCVTLTTCQADEVCYATQQHIAGKDQFFYGCYSKKMCQIIMQRAFENFKMCVANVTQPPIGLSWEQACGVVVRKRTPNLCNACCADGGCNYGSCQDLNYRIFTLALKGKFDLNTLKTTH